MNVFISRPTWVPKPYEEGLNAFIKYLEQEEFDPHTLGTTDFPIDSPLDEVISLMEKSSGVIVLGYPQIEIQKGLIKEEYVKDKHLPTEWNQIEGVLAYSLKKPLLIMHDIGISRGIFDRGAVNKFIHEVDLRKEDWFLDEVIIGALGNWKSKIENTLNFYSENAIYSPKEIELKKEEQELLIKASYDSRGDILVSSTKDGLGISTNRKEFLKNCKGRERTKWEKTISKFQSLELVESINLNNTFYRLTQEGYEFADSINPLKKISSSALKLYKDAAKGTQNKIVVKNTAKGKVIATSEKIVNDGFDNRDIAKWKNALKELLENNLVEKINDQEYLVSHEGFKLLELIN